MRPAVRRSLAAFAAVAALTAGAACQASIDAFGHTPDAARRAADAAFAGFAYRFYNVQRDSAFESTRRLMGRHALIPGRLFRDTTLWSASSDSARSFFVRSWYENETYHFARASQFPGLPNDVGDERHAIRLTWLGDDDYVWQTAVDHAVGFVTPAAVADAIVATLTAAEDRTSDEALADARRAFERTGNHMSLMFSLDSLRTASPGDGSTTVTLGVSFQPDRLRQIYPFLAGYVDRYIMPANYRVRLTGRPGTTYLDAIGGEGDLVIRLRSRDHRLISLEDPAVPIPDSLTLHAEGNTRYRLFRIGFHRLQGVFTIERGPNHRAWRFRFDREPEWDFPPFVARLIRGPLRRPFEGRGIEFMLGVRNDLGGQTLSVRTLRLAVRESAIMRWLGSLGASAFGEFSGRTEAEENHFLYALFAALRQDVAATAR